MADQKIQPMVTVKKPDGTFVKVPLSELKKQAPSAPVVKQTPPAPPAKPAPPVEKPLPKPPAPQPVVTLVKETVKPAKTGEWSRDDAKSPLEEKKMSAVPASPAVSQNREAQVDAVIKKLNFTVAPDIQNRLRSVIQLRLKDLRSEEETRETAVRKSMEGGLNLDDKQADTLVQKCAEILSSATASAKNNLPMVEKEELPANTAPFNSFKGGNGSPAPAKPPVAPVFKTPPPAPVMKTETREQVVNKFAAKDTTAEPFFKISEQQSAKQTMQDITAPPIEMGPVEEIKYTNLTDFRRLSAKPEEAAKRLRQKMYNLQDESFLLYMDALAAYRQSPLYLDYANLVATSLATRKPLASLTQDKNRIQMTEINALLEMEKTL